MKANFKPLLLSSFLILSAFFAVIYASCKQDNCKAISCAYGGLCNDGVCKCLPGYEGTNCETITRKRFVALWSVKEQGTVTPLRQYPLGIENDTSVTVVLIRNLYNYFNGQKIRANVQGDTLIIPNQQLMGKIVFGKGYIHSTTAFGLNSAISIRYEVIDTATQLVDDFGYYSDLDNSNPSEWAKN